MQHLGLSSSRLLATTQLVPCLHIAGMLWPSWAGGEVVQLIAEGRTSKDIALELGLSVKTADAHRANVMRKLDLHSVSELVRYAVRNNIVQA